MVGSDSFSEIVWPLPGTSWLTDINGSGDKDWAVNRNSIVRIKNYNSKSASLFFQYEKALV